MRNLRSEAGNEKNIVAERLRQARLGRGVTQDQLSGQLAVIGVLLDRVAITKIESGTRCVFDFEVRGLVEVLKVDAQWLLGMVDSPAPKVRKAALPNKIGGKGRGL